MSTESYKIRIETQVLTRLHEHIEKQNKKKNKSELLTISKVVNQALKEHLDSVEVQRVDEIYAPTISRIIGQFTKQMENRLATLVAKSTADSARNLFISLDMNARTTGQAPSDVYQKATSFAYKHIKEREQEIEGDIGTVKENE